MNYFVTMSFNDVRKLMTPYAAQWFISLGDDSYSRASMDFDNGVYAVYEKSNSIPEKISLYKSGKDFNNDKVWRILFPVEKFDLDNKIHFAINKINNNYGIGNVDCIEFFPNKSEGRYYTYFMSNKFYTHVFKFSIKNDRVFARKHSVKVNDNDEINA